MLKRPADGSAVRRGCRTGDVDSCQLYLSAASVGHDQRGENVHVHQLSNRSADDHGDLNEGGLFGVGDDVWGELGGQDPLHDKRDLHAV